MSKSKSCITLDAVYDLECADWTTFVRGAIRTADGGTWICRTEDEMLDAILSVRGTVWGHACGTYDTLWVLDRARRRGLSASIILSGSRVLAARIGDTTIRDSYALVPLSLASAAPMFGSRKASTGLACACGRKCGGYCAIRADMPPPMMRRLEDYLAQDVDAEWSVVSGALTWLRDHGAEPRATIGATAWRWAKTLLGLPDATAEYYDIIRRAYYGGRVEVFRTRADRIWRYDIHSSYPAALVRTPVPIGHPRRVVGAEARRAYLSGAPGFYRARVRVPYTGIAPLPVRAPSGRVTYPVGEIEGWFSRVELDGEDVRGIASAIVYDAEDTALAPWCRHVWRLRESDRTRAKWIKLIANSLTGKFAQRPEIRSARILGDGDDLRPGDEIIGPIEGRVACRTVHRHHACGHIAWSATLTASARVELRAQLRHADGDAVYCDTDSVYATRPITRRIGDDLGEWGYEGEGTDWIAAAPKLYSYIATDGAEHVRAKGLPRLTRDGLVAMLAGETWRVEQGVTRFLSAARGQELWCRAVLARSLRPRAGWVGGRVLLPDGSTRPPTAEEVRML